MTQTILIILIFSGAVFYIARMFYKTFNAKETECGGNCSCSKIDVEKIEDNFIKGRGHSEQ